MQRLIIKNGLLLDPALGLRQVGCLVAEDGKISFVGDAWDGAAEQVIHADGCIVTPGLVDFHTHLYPICPTGIPAEAVCFSTGVTTAVDAGSAGARNFRAHLPFLNTCKLRVRCFLHVSPMGLAGHPALEDVSPTSFCLEEIAQVVQEHPQQIIGLKLRTSAPIVRGLGWQPLEKAALLARQVQLPLMVHCTQPPGPMAELYERLHAGDIVTHAYHNKGHTILDAAGQVSGASRRARERGILFDVANARAHFGFSTARAAIRGGFLPDTISTDLTAFGMFRQPTVFSLPMLASRYLALGVSLEDVLLRMTYRPAQLAGVYVETGSLSVGKCADIAVFRLEQAKTAFGDRPFGDMDGETVEGKQLLRPMLTVRNGEIVFRDPAL